MSIVPKMVHRAYCQRDTLNIQRAHCRRIQGSNSRSLPRQNHSVRNGKEMAVFVPLRTRNDVFSQFCARNGMKMRGLFPLRATIPSRERRGAAVSPSCQLPLSTSPVSFLCQHLLSPSAVNISCPLPCQPPQSASPVSLPCQPPQSAPPLPASPVRFFR